MKTVGAGQLLAMPRCAPDVLGVRLAADGPPTTCSVCDRRHLGRHLPLHGRRPAPKRFTFVNQPVRAQLALTSNRPERGR